MADNERASPSHPRESHGWSKRNFWVKIAVTSFYRDGNSFLIAFFFGSRQIGVNWWCIPRALDKNISQSLNLLHSVVVFEDDINAPLMSSSNPVFKHLFINTRQPKHSRFKGFLRYRAQECKKNTSPQKICPKLIGNLFSTRSEDNHLQSRLGQ